MQHISSWTASTVMRVCAVVHLVTMASVVHLSGVIAALECSQFDIQQCLGNTLVALQNAQRGEIPRFTANELHTVCRQFKDAKKCLLQAQTNCTTTGTSMAMMRGLEDMFEYLCDNPRAFNAYVSNSECMMGKNVNASLVACITTYMNQMRLSPEKMCGNMKQLISCNDKALRKWCGVEFATVVKELNVMFAQPMLTAMNNGCRLVTTGSVATTTIQSTVNTVRYKLVQDKSNGATTVFFHFGLAGVSMLLVFLT